MALTGKRLYTCALQIQWLLVSWEYHAEQHRRCSKFLRTVLLPTEGTANMKALKRGSTEEATRRPEWRPLSISREGSRRLGQRANKGPEHAVPLTGPARTLRLLLLF